MNTYMKMSAKDQYHRDFLNSLRERLNVDDKTIANLEKRITGKWTSLPVWWPEIYPSPFRWGALRSAAATEIACRVCRAIFGKNWVFSGGGPQRRTCCPNDYHGLIQT